MKAADIGDTWDVGLLHDVRGPVARFEHVEEAFERHHGAEDRGQGSIAYTPGSFVWLTSFACVHECFVLVAGGPRQPECSGSKDGTSNYDEKTI